MLFEGGAWPEFTECRLAQRFHPLTVTGQKPEQTARGPAMALIPGIPCGFFLPFSLGLEHYFPFFFLAQPQDRNQWLKEMMLFFTQQHGTTCTKLKNFEASNDESEATKLGGRKV